MTSKSGAMFLDIIGNTCSVIFQGYFFFFLQSNLIEHNFIIAKLSFFFAVVFQEAGRQWVRLCKQASKGHTVIPVPETLTFKDFLWLCPEWVFPVPGLSPPQLCIFAGLLSDLARPPDQCLAFCKCSLIFPWQMLEEFHCVAGQYLEKKKKKRVGKWV